MKSVQEEWGTGVNETCFLCPRCMQLDYISQLPFQSGGGCSLAFRTNVCCCRSESAQTLHLENRVDPKSLASNFASNKPQTSPVSRH